MNSVTVKTEKGLVKKLRAIRDKMNEDMQDMTFEETKEYLRKMREKVASQYRSDATCVRPRQPTC
ncbi:MAG: hypothetical protein ACQETL_01045 [Bacteroidota bacterium]